MSMGKKQTVGHRYYLGMHLVLCHGPIDSILKIEAKDKKIWEGNATGGTITISADDAFGGDESEGGVSGPVDILMGSSTQAVNSYLSSKLGAFTPAFRGVVSLVLKQIYIGTTRYMTPWAVTAKRVSKRVDGSPMWYPGKAAIGNDMNPAHIIHECLTDREWGLGYPESDINLIALSAAADTLYAEGMGMSILWDSTTEIENFIQTILDHIDASLFVDRTTGKFTLKLARYDYNPSSVPVLNEDSIIEVTSLKRASQAELYNSVTVTYWDARTGKENTSTIQDIALASQQGRTVGTTVDYPGFTSAELAHKIAMRDLKSLSTPLLSCSLIANRVAAALNPGDVFKLNWPRNGVTNVIMRVASVDIGTMSDSKVRIECVEDVFSTGTAMYSVPPVSGWTSPVSAPAASLYRSVVEAPYRDVATILGDTDAASLPPYAAYLAATGSRPSGDAISADTMVDPGTGTYAKIGVVDFCPTAVLATAVDKQTGVWAITSGVDLDLVRVGTYAVIDDEAIAVTSITDSGMTVSRGVLDTLPASHLVGAVIMFVEDFYTADTEQYGSGETVNVKLLPTTGSGTLSLAAAPANSVSMVGRAARPYPVANVMINGVYFPTEVYGTANIQWASRNRLQQSGGAHVSWYDGSVAPESGVTTSFRLIRNSVVTFSEDGVAGTSKVLPMTEGQYTLQMYTVRGGIESYRKFEHQLNYYLIAPGVYTPEILGVTSGTLPTSATSQSIPLPVINPGDLLFVFAAASSIAQVTTSSQWSGAQRQSGTNLTHCYRWRICDTTEGSTLALTLSAAGSVAYVVYRIRGGTFDLSYSGTPRFNSAVAYFDSPTTATPTVTAPGRPWEPMNELTLSALGIAVPGNVTTYSLPDNNLNPKVAGSVGVATMSRSYESSTKPAPALSFTLDAAKVSAIYGITLRGKFTPTAPEISLGSLYHNSTTSAYSVSLTSLGVAWGPGARVIAIFMIDDNGGGSVPSGWTTLVSFANFYVCTRVLTESDINTSVTFSGTTIAHHAIAVWYVRPGTFGPGINVYGSGQGGLTSSVATVPAATASAAYSGKKNTVLTCFWYYTGPVGAVSSFPDSAYTLSMFNIAPGGIAYYSNTSYVNGLNIPSKSFGLNTAIEGWRYFHIIVEGV